MPFGGLSFVKTLALFGIIYATDPLLKTDMTQPEFQPPPALAKSPERDDVSLETQREKAAAEIQT